MHAQETNEADAIRQSVKKVSELCLLPLPLREREERSLPGLRAARLAVSHQSVEMHADMGGFRRGVGQRDGAVECHPGLVIAAELHQESAAHTEEMKIIRKPFAQRLDHFEAASGPRTLDTATARLSVTTGDGCMI